MSVLSKIYGGIKTVFGGSAAPGQPQANDVAGQVVLLLPPALEVMRKFAAVAQDTEKVVAAKGLNIALDVQEVRDIMALIEASRPLFAMFRQPLPAATLTPAPVL